MNQERVRANKTNRKHDLTWWGEKERRGGSSRESYGGGGAPSVASTAQDRIKVNCDTQIAAGSGLMLLTVPAGGVRIVPFDTVVIPATGLSLGAGNAIIPPYDAVYYVGFSIRLFVPIVAGPIDVTASIYKNGALYQQIIDDQTPAALEKERRFHAGDYVRANNPDTIQIFLVNPTAAPITYAVSDAYLDVGHGPRK